MRYSILVVTIGQLLIGCNEASISESESKCIESTDFGTFENIYLVDEALCHERGLPESRFYLQYPNHLTVTHPNNGADHLILQEFNGGVVDEEFSVGSSNLTSGDEAMALELLEKMAENLESQIQNVKVIAIEKKKFGGEEIHLFEGMVDFSKMGNPIYSGEYRMMILLPFPKDSDITAPLISFIASKNSEIQSFSDFADKGTIGSVWKTFRYF